MPIAVDKVRFEHHQEALGIDERSPRLSWVSSGDAQNWQQASYDIEIQRDSLKETQSFHVDSSDSVLVSWPTDPLSERESAKLRVKVTGTDGSVSEWSPWTGVEAGIDQSTWSCDVIESALENEDGRLHRPVRFRRDFEVVDVDSLAKARLYITAHGLYECHINGQRVGDHVLAPGWTNYDFQLPFQTFDVTSLLRSGKNTIAAYVAEGWYCGRLGFEGGNRNIWGKVLGLQASLFLTPQDGDPVVVNTDKSWKEGFGPLLSSGIYDGEEFDARLDSSDWLLPDFDDSKWRQVKTTPLDRRERLVAPSGPPIRRTESKHPLETRETNSKSILVDFGQNLVGWVKVRLAAGAVGQKVVIQHAEVLQPNKEHVDTRPLRKAKAQDSIILSGTEPIEWEPKFTFHGFRYVEITGLAVADLLSITAVVVHSDMERTGWFECSHPLISKLHENIVWSMRGNFVGVPTDCPQRDERLGWTGDIAVFCKTGSFLYDTAGVLRNWLSDVDSEQRRNKTGIPNLFTPDVFPDFPFKPATAVWGDAVVLVPWDVYQASGDVRVLQAQLEGMKAWIDQGIPRNERKLWDTTSVQQLGDWLDPSAPPSEPGLSRADSVFVANAFLVHITRLMSNICSVTGDEEGAKKYSSDFREVLEAFTDEYITRRGRIVNDSQTAIALAIHFDLLQTEGQIEVAAARLEEIIRAESRFKIATGFVGTAILGPALSKTGRTQVFNRMLEHRRNPSWLYPLTMGATTIWERWDSMLPDGSVNSGEMTSFNHYALGSVADWLHSVMAGITSLEPGWKKLQIAPVPGGSVTSVKAKHLSPYGMIEVSWKIEGTLFQMTVKIPLNSLATIKLPGNPEAVQVGSGTHTFSSSYEQPQWPVLPMYRPFTPHDDDTVEV
ncbi:bacterial alpha-L-rhamnosidase-domain-containing protein [Dactylonectria macrodidyma]|uniref:alpha-L-rhamnosidase n=1 Tax=Dactylonectria macrodidyma TaxID=307937 RepID=A0A9P9FQW5_9HYPO|nr:bacterial alpha-L-rhamnosidase-domain-containing protein [Dactylonectria macrodidyma]